MNPTLFTFTRFSSHPFWSYWWFCPHNDDTIWSVQSFLNYFVKCFSKWNLPVPPNGPPFVLECFHQGLYPLLVFTCITYEDLMAHLSSKFIHVQSQRFSRDLYFTIFLHGFQQVSLIKPPNLAERLYKVQSYCYHQSENPISRFFGNNSATRPVKPHIWQGAGGIGSLGLCLQASNHAYNLKRMLPIPGGQLILQDN